MYFGRLFLDRLEGGCPGILVVQCDSGNDSFNLIASARHILMEERKDAHTTEAVHIALVVQLPRIAGGCRNFVGFQGGRWMSTHIDELRPPARHTPSIEQLIDRPISEFFKSGNGGQSVGVQTLRNCVQAAACRIDNEARSSSSDRSTQRIQILLNLLPKDSDGLAGWFKTMMVLDD